MARIIERFSEPAAQRGKYPWGEWFDGRKRELTQGEDFHCSPHCFAVSAYGKARRMGGRCTCKVRGDLVEVQYFPGRNGA